MDARQAGLEAGRMMLDPAPSLAAALAETEERIARARVSLETAVKKAEWDAERSAESAERLQASRKELRTRANGLRSGPNSFAKVSAAGGVFYIALGVVVILAEFTLLSQILAEVFGLASMNEVGGEVLGPAGVLFSGEWEKAGPLLELYVTTLGVLGLTLAFKAIPAFRKQPDGEDVPTSRWWFDMPRVLFLLIVATIIVTAVARLFLDFGAVAEGAGTSADSSAQWAAGAPETARPATSPVETGRPLSEWVARIVAVAIGLACPFAGYMLFTVGGEAAGRGLGMARVRIHEGLLSVRAWKADRAHRTAKRTLQDAQQKLASSPELKKLATTRATVLDEFRRGFASGMSELLAAAAQPGGYRVVRQRLSASSTSNSISAVAAPLVEVN